MPENQGSFLFDTPRHAEQRHSSAAAGHVSGSSTQRVKELYPTLKKNFIPFMGICQSHPTPESVASLKRGEDWLLPLVTRQG
jgi:hypothetical protein